MAADLEFDAAGGGMHARDVDETRRCRSFPTDGDRRQLDAFGKRCSKTRAHRIADVDHRMFESRQAEKACLCVRVALHRAVVVEMIAAEIAEPRHPHPHAIDATLVERVRGDFHGDVGRAGVGERPQLPVQRDDVGCRERSAIDARRESRAERAEVGAAPREALHGAGQEPGAGCLAVRTRDARDGQPGGWGSVKAVRDAAQAVAQFTHRDIGDFTAARFGRSSLRGIPEDRARAAGRGLTRVIEPMTAAALQSDERIALAHHARIERQAGYRNRRSLRDAREHFVEPLGGAHGIASAKLIGETRARSSGATDISRSAPAVTAEKTGAATSPP